MKSQRLAILKYLQHGQRITPIEAVDIFNCICLHSRIWELRRQGYNIVTMMIRVGKKHVAQYRLIK